MSKECFHCNAVNDDDDEVVVAVYLPSYEAPDEPNSIFTFCSEYCYNTHDGIHFNDKEELKNSPFKRKLKNIDYKDLRY